MFNLLVVDDEDHWVNYLGDHIDWRSVGIETVYKAHSAEEALEQLNLYPIDIVLTDIWMPDMNGLELMRRIREERDKVKCLVLTGHDEFAYAQEALQHQAVDYILKPPKEEELLASVDKAVGQLGKEWERVVSEERALSALRQNLPALRSNLLLDLLTGYRMSQQQWSEKSDRYQLPIPYGQSYALLLVRPEGKFLQYDHNDQSLMEYAIKNIGEEIFAGHYQLWHTKDQHGYFVFYLPYASPSLEEDEKMIQRLAAKFQYKVRQHLKGTISILFSQRGTFPRDLPVNYENAIYAFRQKVGSDREFLMSVEQVRTSPDGSVEALYAPPSMIQLMEAARWEAAQEKIASIVTQLAKKWPDSQEHLMEAGFTLAGAFCYIAHKNGKYMSSFPGQPYRMMMDYSAFQTISGLNEWAGSCLHALKEASHSEAKQSRMSIVITAQEYIEANLGGDVSLQAIADRVFVHPTHLSKLYKQETGEGLSEFILRLRMEKACYLLKNSDDKVYEIGVRIGFPNAAYFIKVFKKEIGLTPQEYRDR